MTEEKFWELIREAKSISRSAKEIPNHLERSLLNGSVEEIADFAAWLHMFLARAHDRRLWVAAAIVAGGLSDDGFEYFKCWLVAQGKEAYEAAIADPDSLADMEYVDQGYFRPQIEMEELLYVPSKAFEKAMGKPMSARKELLPNWTPPVDTQPISSEIKNPDFRTRGKASLENIFPKVVKRFPNWID